MQGVDNGAFRGLDQQAGLLASRPSALPDTQIVKSFESIGQDCEFSFLQRYAGIESLGLFRFTTVPAWGLLKGLQDRFAEINDNTEIELFTELSDDPQGNPDEWFARITAYDMLLHTNRLKSISSEAEIRAEQLRRARMLKRLFLEELEQPQKILVRAGVDDTAEEIFAIKAELDRYGPCRLLWVSLADEDHPSGSVERLSEGFFHGYISEFWMPDGRVMDVLLDQWMSICRNTYRMVFEGEARNELAPVRRRPNVNELAHGQHRESPDGNSFELPFPGARMHVLDRATAYPNSVLDRILVDRELTRGVVYTFQLQVWIPEAFAGSSVSALFGGLPSIKYLTGDLSIRNQWQPVWVTAKIPPSDPVSVVLSVQGNPGDVVLSRNWSLREGCYV